jgi:hypothetical protein
MRESEFRVYNAIEKEILDKIRQLIKEEVVERPKTRADWLRLIRAAIELLPAVPKHLDSGEVIERPRGVSYGE